MGFLDRLFKRKSNTDLDFLDEEVNKEPEPIPEVYEPIELPEGKLVSFSNEVIDTTSKVSIQKFKHNLEILMKETKEKGKIDKFVAIREDDFFPDDWVWRVSSKNTNLERTNLYLSNELRKAYALEQSTIEPFIEIMGIKVPNASNDEIWEAMSKVDKYLGSILLPSRFRSTKHFTVNTALGFTGDYNAVAHDRDFIILDDARLLLDSGYGYSVAYHDLYLDASHESIPISESAIVLIRDDRFDRIMSDEKVAKQLAQRKVIRFNGDSDIAISMVLTENGVLPSRIGWMYANYDNEIQDILSRSIKEFADENRLFFDKSHGGELSPEGGHFSNYYDKKNKDYEQAVKRFISFMREKLPEYAELFPDYLVLNEDNSQQIVEKIGTKKLLSAITEFNDLETKRMEETFESYKQDRKTITPDIHKRFVETIHLINDFYKTNTSFLDDKTEDAIQKFFQGESVSEQLEAANLVWELLPKRDIQPTEFLKTALKTTSMDSIEHVHTQDIELGKNVEERDD